MAILSCQYSIYEKPFPGESVSGDVIFYRLDKKTLLFGIIDGVGHGPLAHAAAKRAKDYFLKEPLCSPIELLLGCHEALKGTRGAVATIVRVDLEKKEGMWAGVGNVSAKLFNLAEQEPVMEPIYYFGCLGYTLHHNIPCRTFGIPAHAVFILHSDGIREAPPHETSLPSLPLTQEELEKRGYLCSEDDQSFLMVECFHE